MIIFTCKIGSFGAFSRFCGSILLEDRNWKSNGFIRMDDDLIPFKEWMQMLCLFGGRDVCVDFVFDGEDEKAAASAIKDIVLTYPLMKIELLKDISEY